MSFLDRLDRKYGRYIPEYVTKILLGGQVLSYLLVYTHPEYASFFYISGSQLLHGQIWKLITILFTPFSGNVLFTALAWYFFYIIGIALERQWGSFRYLMYIAIAYIALLVFMLLMPTVSVSNISLYVSLFLAYAHMYPEVQMLLFFIIPVKVKWLGFLAWIGLLITFLFGIFALKILTIFSIVNFLIFFYNDILLMLRILVRRSRISDRSQLSQKNPHHICAICGKNEIENPNMEIRYCSRCTPTTCYCGDHITHHQHKRLVN